MRDEGEQDFARMLKPVPDICGHFPGLKLTLPDVVFAEQTAVTLPGVTLRRLLRSGRP